MLLLDFCNIKEWTSEAALKLYKTHRIIHSEWGERDGFEKFCASKYQPKSPLVFALVEANEIEPWLSEDSENPSPSEWMGMPILFPSNPGYSQIWRSLQFSKEQFYIPFLDKCSEGILDLNFVNDLLEDFQTTQDIQFLVTETKETFFRPQFSMNNEYLKTIEDHIDWEILSIVLNQPEFSKKLTQLLRRCVKCNKYFLASRNNKDFKNCPTCSRKTSMSPEAQREYQRNRRKKLKARKEAAKVDVETRKREKKIDFFMKQLVIPRDEAINLIEEEAQIE